MRNPFLIGRRIYLRAYEPGDEEIVALSQNHPEPRLTLYYAKPTAVEVHKNELQQKANDPHSVSFIIVDKDNDKAVGNTFIYRIDWVGRMGIYYIAIAQKDNWSRGIGSEVTRLMVDYAFGTLNLNRLQLHVSCENKAAVKAYQKAGYQIEGTLRQAMFHENRYSDFYVMGILRDDWQPPA